MNDDWLWQVNGVEMSGRSQEEVVSYLRSIKFGSLVNIIVSRIDSSNAAALRATPASAAVILFVCCVIMHSSKQRVSEINVSEIIAKLKSLTCCHCRCHWLNYCHNAFCHVSMNHDLDA